MTHTGSEQIGLVEVEKHKGIVDFEFDLKSGKNAGIVLPEIKKRAKIQSETRDGRKRRKKSADLF